MSIKAGLVPAFFIFKPVFIKGDLWAKQTLANHK